MFTGIIENVARVAKLEKSEGNLELYMESPLAAEMKIDQSVAHNGVCLTVVEIFGDCTYRVTAIEETLNKTNLNDLVEGSPVNLERCMTMGDRFDGHDFVADAFSKGATGAVVSRPAAGDPAVACTRSTTRWSPSVAWRRGDGSRSTLPWSRSPDRPERRRPRR